MNQADWERSRQRWREAPEEWSGLTWGVDLTGDAFVEKAEQYAQFTAEKNVLEIGPGYGRILTALLERAVPFARYCGLDLSEETCTHLRERFPRDDVEFVSGDVEAASFDFAFDVVLSSLTFKHLYPSIEPGLQNLAHGAAPGAVFCIDFMYCEGPGLHWDDIDTFIRLYTPDELLEILDRVGLEHIAFDEVRHDTEPSSWRLLMVARKPG